MSKYVKYISSDHYGAPVMKGDRFGYLVEMLRTVLCTGFNEHTDVKKIEVLSVKTFKVTFETAHNYVKDQTIKISGIYVPEINGDCVVISSDELTVTCESYNDLSGILEQVYDNLTDIKTIVSPLGFIEKFKDGNRSAFTTDEEEAFLYIDDEKPDNWSSTATNTSMIIPIVAMTDKMNDIDTFGKYIVPYNTSQPTWFKLRSYKEGTYERNGLWNWVSYGVHTTSGNNTTQRLNNLEYTVIGNGRLFYFLPKLQYINNSALDYNRLIYCFGKINNNENVNDSLTILCASSGRSDSTSYSYNRINGNGAMPFSNVEKQEYGLNSDLGTSSHGVLKVNRESANLMFSPTFNISSTVVNISGLSPNISFPDKYSKKYLTSDIFAITLDRCIGKLSGLKWVYNPPSLVISKDGTIINFKSNNSNKKMYFIRGAYSNVRNTSTTSSNTTYIYNISLDYKDWYNYDN